MGTMWPELIDAMPFGMGPMMRIMGKIPGALNLMKPMFPILFPRLLPMMMPKVMSTMLDRVGTADPHARLHAGTDAGADAQGHGPAHAAHDRRRGAAGNAADDRLPPGKELKIQQKHTRQGFASVSCASRPSSAGSTLPYRSTSMYEIRALIFSRKRQGINYPAASGRGIRRAIIADPRAVSDISFPAFLHIWLMVFSFPCLPTVLA